MRRLRSVFFWLHLAAGLLAGAIILILSFTGAVLAFDPQLVAWAERDARRVPAPAADAVRLPLDALLERARAAAADPAAKSPPRVTGVTVSADPRDAVAVAFGRDIPTRHVNPYTGEVHPPADTRVHDFLHLVEDWHRRLAATGDHRETGRAVTGVANAAFLFLALSGLWLWWPRSWSVRVLRPSLLLVRGATGRARDWNWHNVVGFWSLPVLVVLTATGLVLSYRWASDLPYRLVGETPPAPGPAPAPEIAVPPAAAGAARLAYADLFERLVKEYPDWTELTLREGLPPRRGAAPPPTEPAKPSGPKPFSATLLSRSAGPHFSPTQLVLDPFTGSTLHRAGYAELSPGRKIRLWLRHLHTGQALGWPGQLLAGLASLAGCVLVYTGFALSWRRFFGRAGPAPRPDPAPAGV